MYKKYTMKLGAPNRRIAKIWLIMRLTTVILIATLMQVSAAGFAQRISLSRSNATLKAVIKEIRLQSKYNFIYTEDIFEGTKPININVKNVELKEVLDQLLKGTSLSYTIEEKTIVIKEKNSFADEVKKKITDFFQQDSIYYSGKVLDENGKVLPGASVRLKSSMRGVKTNSEGEFRIKAPRGETTIIVTYIGYDNREINISNNNNTGSFTVQMALATGKLNEVVVSTGYQTLPKERATGSFEVITAKQLQHSNDPNLIRRLEGITTSMNFNNQLLSTNSSKIAATGSNQLLNSPLTNLTIRGKSTLTTYQLTNENFSGIPLVVIDGIASPYSVDLVDPETVETITILKDAAAASIWGSRAANGVIVITTKKPGYNRPPTVSFNTNVNITEKLDLFARKRMSVSEYIDAMIYANGFKPTVNNPTSLLTPQAYMPPIDEILNQVKLGALSADQAKAQIDMLRNNDVRRDYTEHFLRNAVNQNYSLNLSGGLNKITYGANAGYNNAINNTRYNGSDRLNLGFNLSVRPIKKLELRGGVTYAQTNANSQATENVVTAEIDGVFPYTRLTDDSGNSIDISKVFRPSYLSLLENNYGNKILSMRYNPLENMKEGYRKLRNESLNFNFSAGYAILPWLSADLTYNFTRGNNQEDLYYSQNSFYMRTLINKYTNPTTFVRGLPLGGFYAPFANTKKNNTLRGTINVNHTWNEKHTINAIAGMDIADSESFYKSDAYYGYDDQTLKFNNNIDRISNFTFLYRDPRLPLPSGKILPLNTPILRAINNRTLGLYSNAAYTFDNRYTISASLRKDGNSDFGVGENRSGTPFYSLGVKWNINNEKFYHLSWLPVLSFRSSFGYNGNVNPRVTSRPLFENLGTNNTTTALPFGSLSQVPNRNLRPEKSGTLNMGIDFGMKGGRISGSLEYYNIKVTDLLTENDVDPTFGYSRPVSNIADLSKQGIDFMLTSLNLKANEFSWSSNFLFSYNTVKVINVINNNPKNIKSAVQSLFFYIKGNSLQNIYAYRSAGLDPNTGDPRGYLNGQPVSISAANPNALDQISNQPYSEARYYGSAIPVYWGSFRNSFTYGQLTVSANFMYKFGYYFRRSTVDLVNYNFLFTDGANALIGEEFSRRWQKPGDELHTKVPSMVYPSFAARDSFYASSEDNVQKADHIRLQEINLSYNIKSKKNWFLKNPRVYANINNLGIVWRANKLGIDPETADYPNPRTYSFGFATSF